ncbi:hypothetical protein Tco_1248307, partial [Tanacetum coccineum]
MICVADSTSVRPIEYLGDWMFLAVSGECGSWVSDGVFRKLNVPCGVGGL